MSSLQMRLDGLERGDLLILSRALVAEVEEVLRDDPGFQGFKCVGCIGADEVPGVDPAAVALADIMRPMLGGQRRLTTAEWIMAAAWCQVGLAAEQEQNRRRRREEKRRAQRAQSGGSWAEPDSKGPSTP